MDTAVVPLVNVPVLSKTKVSILEKVSIASPPLTKMPRFAPLPIPATFETGAPMTKAPGQPRTKTVMAKRKSRLIRPTSNAISKTVGV